MKSYTSAYLPVYISSSAEPGSAGGAGSVTVNVSGDISMTGTAAIGSNTYTSRNAGQVVVDAGGNITLQDGSYFSWI